MPHHAHNRLAPSRRVAEHSPVSEVVKYRSVSLTVYPWKHPSGRDYWRFRKSDGKHCTRATLEKAKAEAKKHAQDIHRGTLDLSALTPDQTRKLQRIVEADPTLAMVDEFLLWHSKKRPKKLCSHAIREFLAVKQANAGDSPHNMRILTKNLSLLPGDKILADITVADLPVLAGEPRTKKNVRASWVTFFRWCRDREYLPYNEKTAPERLERPRIARKIPETFSPAQFQTLLENVRPAYLPWLALVGMAGLRTEEVCPQHGSSKDSLRWEDIHLDRRIIIVRPETAKTGHRRVTPICDALLAILKPIMGKGIIGPKLYPSKPLNVQTEAETTRLGKLVGGWKRNGLRHSFISYRAAIVGISQTAMEAGNSESEAKRSYNDAKSRSEAKAWFKCGTNVLQKP